MAGKDEERTETFTVSVYCRHGRMTRPVVVMDRKKNARFFCWIIVWKEGGKEDGRMGGCSGPSRQRVKEGGKRGGDSGGSVTCQKA